MCNCRQGPLERTERYIRTNGWSKMVGSQMEVIDEFIFNMLGVRPSTNEERPDLYGQAKSIQKK